jgi:hypothetical protein
VAFGEVDRGEGSNSSLGADTSENGSVGDGASTLDRPADSVVLGVRHDGGPGPPIAGFRVGRPCACSGVLQEAEGYVGHILPALLLTDGVTAAGEHLQVD